MKKIDALRKILSTKKVAYNAALQEAMHCDGVELVREYRVKDMIVLKHNYLLTQGLLSEGWEVTDEDYYRLDIFAFPQFWKELSVEDAFKLLSLPPSDREVECSDGGGEWEKGELKGVLSGEYPFYVKIFDKAHYGCKHCRIKV